MADETEVPSSKLDRLGRGRAFSLARGVAYGKIREMREFTKHGLSCVTPQPLTDFSLVPLFHPLGKLQTGIAHYALSSPHDYYRHADSMML